MTHPTTARWRVGDRTAGTVNVWTIVDTGSGMAVGAAADATFAVEVVALRNALVEMIETGPLWGQEYEALARVALELEPSTAEGEGA